MRIQLALGTALVLMFPGTLRHSTTNLGFPILALQGWETTGPTEPPPAPPDSSSQSCTLRIHVDGFRNTYGNLGTILFRSPDGWPEDKDKSFRRGPAPIDKTTRTAVAVWPNLPPGDYAVAAIHDENSNAKLDRTALMLRSESQILISWDREAAEPTIEGDFALVADSPLSSRVLAFGYFGAALCSRFCPRSNTLHALAGENGTGREQPLPARARALVIVNELE